jgi:enterochelin esterase-like enzyme
LICRWFSIVAAAALVLIGAAAQASDIQRKTVYSWTLKRPMPFNVYLPDGFEPDGGRRYPVLYLLHGAGGDENAWVASGRIKQTADQLMASGEIPPAIIVMPGCKSCWWVDGAKDAAETAFWTDLEPHISSQYPVIPGRDGRLVAGLSAGGYGAVRFALKYADRIAAAAALSPAVYAEAPPIQSAARSQPPFKTWDGRFDLASWRARNYPNLMADYLAQPFRVPLYLVSGDNDKFGIAFETALLFKRMFEVQPDRVELRVVDGDHSWAIWSRAIASAMRYVFSYTAKPVVVTQAVAPPRPRPMPELAE